MASLLRSGQRAFLGTALLAIVSSQMQSCASSSGEGTQVAANGGSTAYSNGGTAGNLGTGGSNVAGSSFIATGGTAVVSTGGTSAQAGASAATGGSAVQSSGGNALTGGNQATGGKAAGGASATGGSRSDGGSSATGGSRSTGGSNAAGGSSATGGSKSTAGSSATGGIAAVGGTTAGGSSSYIVSLVQSSKSQATDITQDDINTMVADAITQAGGLDFIHDGQTVVLKPNLLTHMASCWGTSGATLSPTVNGVTTDWRIAKAVADLVRAKNPTGKILVMEGSNRSTTAAFAALGYTSANFGTSVDEFIALEGSSCSSRSQTGLVQKAGHSGKQYWINDRYFQADVIISLGALKSHGSAGITGCVKNIGIGSTPNAMYSTSTNAADCSRSMTASYIDHSFNGLGDFISDYYSIKPVDFAIMDGLQGMQNGPCSTNAADKKNMRLILASKNAVALDTVQAAVMNCTGSKVPYLTKLETWGMGTTDLTKITVVGNKTVAQVRQSFTGAAGGVCN